MTDRTCSDCGKGLGRYSTAFRCRPCSNRHFLTDPEINARRLARLREKAATPEFRKMASRAAKAAGADPVLRAKRSAASKANYPRTLGSEKCRLAALRPEALAKVARGVSEAQMRWCPPEYRAEYRALMRKHKMTKARAQRIIMDKLTPFERQLDAIRLGARLIEKPVYHSRPYDFTLGGVSSMEGT
jgi:hypothetical protein